jgi:hypothetical protein
MKQLECKCGLAPCPLCGGKAAAERMKLNVPNPHRVRCGSCGASSGWFSSKKEAAARWTARVSAPAAPADARRLCYENGRYAREGD